MLTVACVLKTGPEYQIEHVLALAAGVERNLTIPHRFVCLTDCGAVRGEVLIRSGIEPIALKHGWVGWWSKIELFRPGLFDGPVFYADLDTVIVGSLDELVLGHRFTVLRNFWAQDRIGSGLMAWSVDLSVIYRRFLTDPDRHIREFVTTDRWGDQGFIKMHAPQAPALWQVKYPGRIVSYKRDVVRGGMPDSASIVCFHGKPRPWETDLWPGRAAA